MTQIPLTRGYVALVDAADAPLVQQYRWHAKPDRNTVYAEAWGGRDDNGKQSQILMHRLILDFPAEHVDHEDGNGLNNQRNNLRVAGRKGNARNRRKQSAPASSSYKGVSFSSRHHHRLKPWVAYIYIDRKKKELGHFATESEAARAYNVAAAAAFGAHAQLNQIGDQQ